MKICCNQCGKEFEEDQGITHGFSKIYKKYILCSPECSEAILKRLQPIIRAAWLERQSQHVKTHYATKEKAKE